MYEACNQIPFLSGNTAFIGNITGTLNSKYKGELTWKIFSGNLTEKELQGILKKNRISYIFVGYQEKSLGGNLHKYSFLKPTFQNQEVTIFKVF